MKYIVFTTKISIPSISNVLVDKSIHFYYTEIELNNYISNFASSNGIKKSSVTIEYDIIPLNVFKQAEAIIKQFGLFKKEANIAIWFLLKNELLTKKT
jgi:hypothetical protein